jgi:hypothetical protein
MMENIAQAGDVRVGGAPTPFHYIYHHVQSCTVLSSWRGRYTPPISSLPLSALWNQQHNFKLEFNIFTWKLSSRLSKLSLNPSSTMPVVRTRLRRMSSTVGVKPSSRILNKLQGGKEKTTPYGRKRTMQTLVVKEKASNYHFKALCLCILCNRSWKLERVHVGVGL